MKFKVKIGLIVTALVLVLTGITACTGQKTANQQTSPVTVGSIDLKVSGSGKIEAAKEARLTFGSGGKVQTIAFKEGDSVKAGQVLAKLDTRPLELSVSQSQVALSQAEVSITQMKVSEQTAAKSLNDTKDSEDTLKLAVLNAQITLDTSRDNLSDTLKTYNWDTFETVDSALNKARTFYKYALDGSRTQPAGTGITGDWELTLKLATDQLESAQANYDNFISGHGNEKITIKKEQVKYAEMSLAKTQKNLDDLNNDISLKEAQLILAKQNAAQSENSTALARQSLSEARRILNEATITAPFDGIIAQVGAKEGDTVAAPSLSPGAIIYMVEPQHVQLVVDVDEIDIPTVKLNQEAVITLDALVGKEFKGTVSAIYPVSKEEGGVVLYSVRLTLDAPPDSGIKVGMSASADIVVARHDNVLTVPSRAVSKNAAGKTVVKVISGTKVEERVVVEGLDDGLRTEITSGLNAGETVVVDSKASTSGVSMF
jgi:HlyD family secretion protein